MAMKGIKGIFNYFGIQDEEEIVERETIHEEEIQDQETQPNRFEQRRQAKNQQFTNVGGNVVSLHTQKQSRMILSEPRSYDEAQQIADELRNKRSVIVNLQRTRPDLSLRIVDFLSGTVYALHGSISKLGPSIYLCAPDNMEVQGVITEMTSDNNL